MYADRFAEWNILICEIKNPSVPRYRKDGFKIKWLISGAMENAFCHFP